MAHFQTSGISASAGWPGWLCVWLATRSSSGRCGHESLRNSVRQAKFVRSRKRKGACLCNCPFDIVAKRACVGVIQGRKPREAKMRAASIEPVSASLRKVKVASLPNLLKPVINQEATGVCTGWAFRGGRGRRVSKDLTGTWETRRRVPTSRDNEERECITSTRLRSGVGGVRSSVEAR
jgi:hypothetical protein